MRGDSVIRAVFVRNVGLKKHQDRAHSVKMEKTEVHQEKPPALPRLG